MLAIVVIEHIYRTRHMVVHMHTCVHCHNNAGTIIGQKYGVAKKATAIAVRVFDATGKGSSAYVYIQSHVFYIWQTSVAYMHDTLRDSLHTSQISHLLLYPSLWLLVPGLSSQFLPLSPIQLDFEVRSGR